MPPRIRLTYALFLLWPIIGLRTLTDAETREPPTEQIKLQKGENYVTAAVLNEGRGFAYFATATDSFQFTLNEVAAKIVNIELSDFHRIGALKLAPGDNPLRAPLLDPSGNFVYFGVYGDPNRAVPARIVKIPLVGLGRSSSVTLGKDQFGISSAVIDPAGEFGYFGTLYGSVVGVRLRDLALVGNLGLQSESNAFQCAVIDRDGNYGYFGTSAGNIMKIGLRDFTPAGNLTVLRNEPGFSCAIMDSSGKYAYFGTQGTPAKIVRIALADFKPAGILALGEKENKLVTALYDPRHGKAYFVTGETPAKLISVDLPSFSRGTTAILPPVYGSVTCGILDAKRGTAYLAAGADPARILKVVLTP